VWTAFSQAAAVVFFPGLSLLHWASAAYLGVDFDELANELFEAAEFSDLAFGLFLGSRSWQRFGDGLALLFVGQAHVWAMNRLAGLVAVTVGFTATAAGIGNGSAAEIAKTGQLFDDFRASKLQIWQRIGHSQEASSILAYYIRTDRNHKKKKLVERRLSGRAPVPS
jgi:hypothetical protein